MRSCVLVLAALVGACGSPPGSAGAPPEPDETAGPVAGPSEPPPATGPKSVYTTLDPDVCVATEVDEETGGTTQRCPGVAGYTLLVHDFDARMTVDVVTPDGAVFPLGYPSVITSAFSSLGPSAEWRIEGAGATARPVGLVIRVNVQAGEEQIRPTLTVARVSATGACVTDRIGPSADANERARRAADGAAGRPCLEGLPPG